MSSWQQYSISVPGSIMLLGEHAVLHGESAVVCAVNRRMTVMLTPQQDQRIIIQSALGEYQTSPDHLTIEKPFHFVLSAIQSFEKKIASGFRLDIHSAFSDSVGLGSSAAVTVATLAVLQQWLFGKLDLDWLYQMGVQVIRNVQGMGSGADVAASVYGGVIDYDPWHQVIKNIDAAPPISLIYSGYKMPTSEVIAYVNQQASKAPEYYESLYQAIGRLVKEGVEAILQQDWKRLGVVFNQHQLLQDKLGVNDDILQKIIDRARRMPNVLGAKISGSGLGDCIVTIGHVDHGVFVNDGLEEIEVQVSTEGIKKDES